MGQPVQLIALGPFDAVDTTSAGPYVSPNSATLAPNANPHRVPSALTAELGRTHLATLGLPAPISAIAPYIPATNDEQVYGVQGPVGNSFRVVYDVRFGTETHLQFGSSFDKSQFTQAVQIGNVLYDNAGRQYSVLNPGNTYEWQYQPFTADGTDIGGITVSTSSTVAPSGFYSVELDFTFTRVVYGPNGAYAQESSAPSLNQGNAIPQFPAYLKYTFPPSGTIHYPQLNGPFHGTNDDGTVWSTNVYVQSNVIPTWFFAIQLKNQANYVVAPATLFDYDGNAQLIPTRDPPPVSPTNNGPIAYHKGSAWCFVVNPAFVYPNQNNTTTPTGVNLQQMQIWWSKYGIPWEFDETEQVQIVDANVPPGVPPYGGLYGEQPQALVSLASVLLAWTTQQTIIVYGDGTSSSPYVLRKLFNIGCTSGQSVAVCVVDQMGVVTLWLSEDGVQMTEGQYAYRVDEQIRSFIDGLSSFDRQQAVGWFANHAYYISFPNADVTWGLWLPTMKWFGPLEYATPVAYAIPANPATPLDFYGPVNEVVAVRQRSLTRLDTWFTGGDLNDGQPQTVTWVGPTTTCGDPRRQKSFEFISVNAPVQPGIFATVTLTTESGVVEKVFDLGKGPATVTTVGDDANPGPFLGYLGQLTVSFNTTGSEAVPTAQIWAVTVDGSYVDMQAFDNGAVQ